MVFARPVRFRDRLRLQVWKRESSPARAAERRMRSTPKEHAMTNTNVNTCRCGSVCREDAAVGRPETSGTRTCQCGPVCACAGCQCSE